jgi:hypothetical protein
MKDKNHYVLITFILLFFLPGLLCSNIKPGDFPDIFELQGAYNTRVSIEKGWARTGNIPVVLTFGDLEISLQANAAVLEASGGIETGINEILMGNSSPMFTVYEQNALRTRMWLAADNIPVILKINRETNQAEFFIAGCRLNLEYLRVTFTEIIAGETYELTFDGPDVHAYKRFILNYSSGTVRAVPFAGEPSIPDDQVFEGDVEPPVWAIKVIHDEPRKSLDLEEGK